MQYETLDIIELVFWRITNNIINQTKHKLWQNRAFYMSQCIRILSFGNQYTTLHVNTAHSHIRLKIMEVRVQDVGRSDFFVEINRLNFKEN